ncbi:hypothetical protein MYSTI_04391 [Myxococcus stipitatus DSM 14675]|uniref:Uncharacterized protein n=1 Tax=Myxococcus stipitatus (strain DSM 14675 / JCM 12634 / Mx s8) TaxID=1278073 RepID=L7UDJ6_MYXSD|nr:hypothetical protein [Myxococcus stipitatus]AGC45687.1 hypothetical protein MYSTI_04391 [Myxococcus stipitatus DSM 14675]
MLLAVESYFHDALRPAVPETVDVATGPSQGPAAEVEALVEVCASSFKLALPEGDDLTAQRQPSYFAQVHRWPGNGTTRDFTLPANAQGQVAEVESPPGRPLRRGDDYTLEGTTLRLYRAPMTADEAVVAFLRGERAEGFLERRRCELKLTVRAWVKAPGNAAPLLSRALAAALAASSDLGNLEDEDTFPEESGVRMRLLQPAATLLGVTRTLEAVGTTFFSRAQASFLIRGECEQLISLGTPEPVGIIREVRRDT